MSKTNKIKVEKSETRQDGSISHIQKKERNKTVDSPIDRVLHLQRTIGNQAVQRLFKSGTIQPKLKIGKPNDKYEKEADRVADIVMRMPEPKILRQTEEEEEEELVQPEPIAEQITPLVQRQVEPEEEEEEEPIQAKILSTENPVLQRQEEEEEEELVQPKLFSVEYPMLQRQAEPEEEEEESIQRQEEEPIQAKPITEQITPLVQRQAEPEEEEEEEEPIQAKGNTSSTAKVTPTIESSINSLSSGGQPLSKSVRNYFEPRFGANFEQVRIHNNSQAANIAGSINAKAFTTGKDVVFSTGQYLPETSSGKRLLAHELTHVVQQENTFYSKSDASQTSNLPKQINRMDIGIQRQEKESGGTYGGIVAENAKDIAFWENIAKKGGTYGVPIPIPTEWKPGVGMGLEGEITVKVKSGEKFGDYVFIMVKSGEIYFKYKSNVIKSTEYSWWKKSLLAESKDNLELRQKLRSYAIRKKEKEEPPIMRISTKILFEYNKWEPKWPAAVDNAAEEIQSYLNFSTFHFPESIVPPIEKRTVRILGFASQEGPLASNQRLSQKRADRVKKLLEDRGIPSNKLIAKGMGVSVMALKRKPVGYWKDRRVIFLLDPPIGIVRED